MSIAGILAALCTLTSEPQHADAAVGFYGAQIVDYIQEKPKCPALLVFGDEDASIPPDTIAAIRGAHPEVAVEIYPGPHGFACDHRAAFRPESARLAFARALDFLERNSRLGEMFNRHGPQA